MTERLEEISDQDVIDAITEHVKDLNYELGDLHHRVQASLGRMDYMDKYGLKR